jgi:hypothetical protein
MWKCDSVQCDKCNKSEIFAMQFCEICRNLYSIHDIFASKWTIQQICVIFASLFFNCMYMIIEIKS